MLHCEECGCCSELGKGWVGEISFDPKDSASPCVVVYCPPCAATEFGYRSGVAATYVCVWEPLPGDTGVEQPDSAKRDAGLE